MNREKGILIGAFILDFKVIEVFTAFKKRGDFSRFNRDRKKFLADLLIDFP